MEPLDLERLVDRELQRLPPPRAPRTLLPRVMTAAGLVPARTWRGWLHGWQAAWMCAVVGVVVVGWTSWPQVIAVIEHATQLSAAVRALWNVLVGPIVWIVLIITAVVALACAAAWTAVSKVTFGGVSSR